MFTPDSIELQGERFTPFINQEQISTRISCMGKQLDNDIANLK